MFIGVVVLGVAAACSSSKSNTTPTGLDAGALGAGTDGGGGGGGGGGDSAMICANYQAAIDKNAPNCQADAPAGTFEASCHQVRSS